MKKQLFLLGVATIIGLIGCGNAATPNNNAGGMDHSQHGGKATTPNNNSGAMDHSGMNHSGSAEVPQGLKVAQNPKYKVGSQAIVNVDHMPGMKGATATISGAYDTTAYVVSYNPTTGGQRVTNHKWVIHEELKDAGGAALKPGAQATIDADHMAGMKGATATIESAEHTTVYMIDYTPTTGGEKVTNHKWVTESELAPK